MATEVIQNIPARLKNVATNGHVAGAVDIIDDTKGKTQDVINADVDTAIGTDSTEGSIKGRIASLETLVGSTSVDTQIDTKINALDATESQTAGTDGLALSVTETNGKITAISGSIAAETYDAYGAATTAKSEVLATKGTANGIASLDSACKVPSSQLPAYVDDVLEYANQAAFPAEGESGKIYVALDTNRTYRWSGSTYVEISQSLALGETSSTAFAGDRGVALENAVGTGGSVDTRIAAAKTEIIGGATANGNTLKKVEDRTVTLETAVGNGGSVDSRIAIAKSTIIGDATAACDTLGEAEALISANATAIANEAATRTNAINSEATARANAVSAEATRAQAAEGALQQLYENLTQSDIVVVADHTQVAPPSANTIYREQGTNAYSDWMWYNNAWQKMAEYDNAVDDAPTAGSNNLVKSGGVDSVIVQVKTDLENSIYDIPNLIDPTKTHIGFYLNHDGAEEDPQSMFGTRDACVSDYIPVIVNGIGQNISSENAYQGGASYRVAAYCVYDSYCRFLRSGTTRHYEYQTGDFYVKFCFFGTSVYLTPMANYGNIANTYIQYCKRISETQRAKVAEQSIKTEISPNPDGLFNIIDPNFVTKGYYLRASDGQPVEDTLSSSHQGSYSDYISVFINGTGYNVSSENSYRGGAAMVASYVVYDENMDIIRIHAAQNNTSDRHYVYQDGDYYVRFSFFTNDPLMANYGSGILSYTPYRDSLINNRVSKLEKNIKEIPIGNVINGKEEVICTGDSDYWIDGANSNFYDNYFEFFENAGEGQTWVSSILLYPDMGKYLYVKAKVTNTGEGVTNYNFLVNPVVYSDEHEWQTIGFGTLQIGESKEVLLPVDLANLVIYHNFHNTLAIWVQCSANANYNTKIKIENFKAYQINDNAEFAHFEGNNLPELMHSIDNAFDNVEPSGASNEILTGPTGKKYLLSVDINGALTTIPLYPKEMYAYGNSLLISRGFGLAASDQYHDFYALLCQFFLTKESQFASNKTGITFEQSTTLQDALSKADALVQSTPATSELLIIQGGDNVASANYETIWKPALSHFIESLRQKCTCARIILVASWYGSLTDIMTEVANKYGVLFVNIVPCRSASSNSYLGAIITNIQANNRSLANVTSCVEQTNDSEYYEYKLAVTFTVNSVSYDTTLYCHTYSLNGTTLSYNSEQEVIDTAGEASHPGNEGFRLIANKILYEGGYVDTPEYYTSN